MFLRREKRICCACTQCVPSLLPTLWEGPWYEAISPTAGTNVFGRTFDLFSEYNTLCACAVAVGAEPSPESGGRPVHVRMHRIIIHTMSRYAR